MISNGKDHFMIASLGRMKLKSKEPISRTIQRIGKRDGDRRLEKKILSEK